MSLLPIAWREAARGCCNRRCGAQHCEDPRGTGGDGAPPCQGPAIRGDLLGQEGAANRGSVAAPWLRWRVLELEQREAGVSKSTIIRHMGCEIFIAVHIIMARG